MRFIDVAGPPGVGKSTLLDPLWPPRCIPLTDGPYPIEWAPFMACVSRLLYQLMGHPSYAACASMTRRSIAKMASVAKMKDDRVYIQTGFAQRGLGIGWRLRDQEAIAEYFELMPISLGVVLLYADVATVQRRNVERGKDRSHMVPLMERPREIAAEVLRRRGVSLLKLDTRTPVEACRAVIKDFADAAAGRVRGHASVSQERAVQGGGGPLRVDGRQ